MNIHCVVLYRKPHSKSYLIPSGNKRRFYSVFIWMERWFRGERAGLCFNTKAGVKPGVGWLGEFRTENHQGPVEYVGESFKDIKQRPRLCSSVLAQ